MKPSQRQLYADRIDRVVRHLEERAPEEAVPTLAELASIAAMSEFHFHRVFHLMTGETVGEAVRRIRLARSLPELASETKVTAAAGASGYATSQGYARALRRQADTSATGVRADGRALDALVARLRSPSATPGRTRPPVSVEVVSLSPFRLLAVRNVGDYAELNTVYARLFDLVLASVPPEDLLGIYGVPYDDPRHVPAEACRCDCALAIPDDAAAAVGDLMEMTLGGGSYVRARHLGDYDAIHPTIDLAYAGAIGLHDCAFADGPLFIHYLDDPEEVAEADLRSDIYLPVVTA